MKVLVVGSVPGGASENNRGAFEAACRSIGTALSSPGMEVVVGSDGKNTADRYIVEGAAATPHKPTVWVVRPDSPGSGRPALPPVSLRISEPGRSFPTVTW